MKRRTNPSRSDIRGVVLMLFMLLVAVTAISAQSDGCGPPRRVEANNKIRYPKTETGNNYLWYRTEERDTLSYIRLYLSNDNNPYDLPSPFIIHFTTSNTQEFWRIRLFYDLETINPRLVVTGKEIETRSYPGHKVHRLFVGSNKPVVWINCTSDNVISIPDNNQFLAQHPTPGPDPSSNTEPSPNSESSPPWTYGYCTVGVTTEGVLLAILVVLESVVIYHLYYRGKGPWVNAGNILRQNTDKLNTEIRAEENTEEGIYSYATLTELFRGRDITNHTYQNQADSTMDHMDQNQTHSTMDHTYQNQTHGTMDHSYQNQAQSTKDHMYQNQAHNAMDHTYEEWNPRYAQDRKDAKT